MLGWTEKIGIKDGEDFFHTAIVKYLESDKKEDITISWFFRVILNDWIRQQKRANYLSDNDFKRAKKLINSIPEPKDWDKIYTEASQLKHMLDETTKETTKLGILGNYLAGKTRVELSEELGINLNTLHTQINRTRSKLSGRTPNQ